MVHLSVYISWMVNIVVVVFYVEKMIAKQMIIKFVAVDDNSDDSCAVVQ